MTYNHFQHNSNLFKNNNLSTDDVLLVPQSGVVKSRKKVKFNSSFIYSAPMDTVTNKNLSSSMLASGQSPVSCRYDDPEVRVDMLNQFHQFENFWFSVGLSYDDYEMLTRLFERSTHKVNICVDVAHGDMILAHKFYDLYSKAPWCRNLMSGSVATPESAISVFQSGCTHIRIGIGPGSACSTRIVTGCGYPNLSAVYNIYEKFESYSLKEKVTLIADGGIKTTGDIAKYLSAGADAVMLGSLLSKTTQSPGWKVNKLRNLFNKISFGYLYKNKIKYKEYRGQASEQFQMQKIGYVSGTPEGVQAPPLYTSYSWEAFYNKITSSLASSVSYLGLNSIYGMSPKTVKFIKITNNTLKESHPHILS